MTNRALERLAAPGAYGLGYRAAGVVALQVQEVRLHQRPEERWAAACTLHYFQDLRRVLFVLVDAVIKAFNQVNRRSLGCGMRVSDFKRC